MVVENFQIESYDHSTWLETLLDGIFVIFRVYSYNSYTRVTNYGVFFFLAPNSRDFRRNDISIKKINFFCFCFLRYQRASCTNEAYTRVYIIGAQINNRAAWRVCRPQATVMSLPLPRRRHRRKIRSWLLIKSYKYIRLLLLLLYIMWTWLLFIYIGFKLKFYYHAFEYARARSGSVVRGHADRNT